MAATTTTTTTTTAAAAMEAEILKRNTDCVYFLASPLTCKKGSECEYRHSDIARLNPRDCWYWLSGNCLNPTCAFRHPPLEGLTETSSNSVHVAHHSVVATSKTNVPCYFYFNTCCMKGDQCPFSHVMDDVSHGRKFPKTATPEATSSHLVVNKTCTENDTGPSSVEIPENPADGTSKEPITVTQAKVVIADTAPNNISEEASHSHESPGSSNPDYEKPIIKSPDNPSPEDKYINRREDSFSERSSEELVENPKESEEWWESSPGFDVLVDDGSEQLAYEDDVDYLQVRERESERLHNHLMHFDYEDSTAYDSMDFPDAGFMYDHSLYDAYEHFNDGYAPDYAGRIPEPSGERMLEPMLHRKRRSPQREWGAERGRVDLRDHLRKRRRVDTCLVSRNSRKHHPSHTKSTSQKHLGIPGMHLTYQDRLTSELRRELRRNNIRSSRSERESALDESCRREGRLGYPYFSRSIVPSRNSEMQPTLDENHRRFGRLGYRDFARPIVHPWRRENRGKRGRRDRQHSLPQVLAIEELRPMQMPVASSNGPRRLSQLRDEKRNVHAGRYGSENHVPRQLKGALSTDFEGPKSLSELLKDKKKFTSVSDSWNESATDYEATYQPKRSVINGYPDEETEVYHRSAANRLDGCYKSDFSHNAEEDDDDLARKVARILA
uniref:Zinc finger CCCH domain-containing protein 34 n=1 Tax=Anthurium amnicola TaxID=1678845 RepID=A0A1D1XEC2_9ARAE